MGVVASCVAEPLPWSDDLPAAGRRGLIVNAVQMTAKLYKARDTARALLGERFAEKMHEYGDLIQQVAKAKNIELIPAMTAIAKVAVDDGYPYAAMFTMAACVELIEPTEVRNA